MALTIKNAQFVTSVADKSKIMENTVCEIAIAGRSNVGKSSFINFLTNNSRLAKTSKEPGRTRLINYFSCNNGEFMLVDLPGYGFARVSDAEKLKWGDLIEGYLRNSQTLKNVFVLVDIRRDPAKDDIMMINYLHHFAIPFTVIATKADKVSRAEAMQRRRVISTMLAIGVDNIILTSALGKTGKDAVLMRLEEIMDV